jgi:hypothetical protein
VGVIVMGEEIARVQLDGGRHILDGGF